MKIAVLAVQGAFREHEIMLDKLGYEYMELRKQEDVFQPFDGLILPGGESTVQGKLLRDQGMLEPLKTMIREGLPVLATCAGMILLADKLSNDSRTWLQTLPITVMRNAYGRQLGSFSAQGTLKGIGSVPMEFVRGPYVEAVSPEVEVLAEIQGKAVAVRYKNQLALSFHPELNQDPAVHHYFLHEMVKSKLESCA